MIYYIIIIKLTITFFQDVEKLISDECILNLVTHLIFTRSENGVDREAWEQEKGESEGENKGEWEQEKEKEESEGLITNSGESNDEKGKREVKEKEGEYSQAGLYILFKI